MFVGNRGWLLVGLWLIVQAASVEAQIDPEKRRLIQIGYNQPVQGRAPIAAYGFFYYNQPGFFRTNMTLRLSVAPIYLDAEVGFKGLLGSNTDLGVGIAGGGFADSYGEIRQGRFLREESFLGHGGEISTSLYHLFNPEQMIPLHLVMNLGARESVYRSDSDTADDFEVPQDLTTVRMRTGLRFGGQEPSMTEPMALELSVWHEARVRASSGKYGFNEDRKIESHSHLLWGRALLKYALNASEQMIAASLTAGTTWETDRFSAYRLGGLLPFSSEFPLSIPGYYFQEISAKRFALINAQYSFPLLPSKNLRVDVLAAGGWVDYLRGLEQDGDWHYGVGGGISYISPAGAWLISLLYGHGFDAIRRRGRGADQVALLFQYDFEAKSRGKSRFFVPGMNPYGSQGGERIFR